jgi:hypothetical protein
LETALTEEGYLPAARQLETTFEKVRNLRIATSSTHPDWLIGHDARCVALENLSNVLRAARIAVVVLETHLVSVEWWRAYRGFRPSIKEASFDIYAFAQASKNHLLFFSFSAVEHCIRLILRRIAPRVASDATAEFSSVAAAFFRRVPDVAPEHRVALEISRLARNSYHNVGVHSPRSGESVVIKWRGYDCEFAAGQPIEFATWAFVADLVDGLVDLIENVFAAGAVVAIVEPIVDVSAYPYREDV